MARDFPNNGDTSHPLPPRGRFRPEVGWWSPSLTRRAREGNLRGVQTFFLIVARSAGQRPVVNTSYRSVFDSPFPLVTGIESQCPKKSQPRSVSEGGLR